MRALLSLPVLAACVAEPAATSHSLRVSGHFAGRYEVPVPSALAAAATYPVDEVEWSVVADTVKLDYDLPPGLVGGRLPVELRGSIDEASERATLDAPIGTGVCSIEGSIVTCHESFTNLGALPISLAVVEQHAAAEYEGPVGHRIAVAHMFASEPLGIVVFDLAAPVVEDSPDDKPEDD